MNWITRRVLFLSRSDWGAREDLPRLGSVVGRRWRFYDVRHHTVIVDSDVTKNVWETLDEVKAQMRRLQTIRPDLGLDVPYNFVLFVMDDGTIVVCEGRGYERSGAHTAGVDNQGDYFNTVGIATAIQGDTENFIIELDGWRDAFQEWGGHLKREFPNIGTKTVCARPICGHKDYASYSSQNATACPGWRMYEFIKTLDHSGRVTEDQSNTEEDEMREELEKLNARVGLAGLFAGVGAKVALGITPSDEEKGQLAWWLQGWSPRDAVRDKARLAEYFWYAEGRALRGLTLDPDVVEKLRWVFTWS